MTSALITRNLSEKSSCITMIVMTVNIIQHERQTHTHTRRLTAIEGAESQIVQRLLAVTARTASAAPLVIVVTA